MACTWNDPCYASGFHKHVTTLAPDQLAFPCLLDKWVQQPTRTLIMVAGGPGSGKTYTVAKTLDHVRLTQLRMAPTARVASNIDGRTIHSALKLNWKEGSLLNKLEKELVSELNETKCIERSKELLNIFQCMIEPSIVVIDEIGMVPHWLTYWIIQYFFLFPKPILIVVMGDPNQLRPVKSEHNVFSATMALNIQRIDLVGNKRFTESYATIVTKLRHYVHANDVDGMMGYICSQFPIVPDINKDILMKCTRAMAYLKVTVDSYNNYYLTKMVEGPRIRLWKLNSKSYVDVKRGCHMFVTQNGVSSALNGTPLIFDHYDDHKDWVYCTDPKSGRSVTVGRNFWGEFPISVGFAGTVHKFQGDTMDDAAIAINFNTNTNLHLIYTALSRVRSKDQIVAIQL